MRIIYTVEIQDDVFRTALQEEKVIEIKVIGDGGYLQAVGFIAGNAPFTAKKLLEKVLLERED